MINLLLLIINIKHTPAGVASRTIMPVWVAEGGIGKVGTRMLMMIETGGTGVGMGTIKRRVKGMEEVGDRGMAGMMMDMDLMIRGMGVMDKHKGRDKVTGTVGDDSVVKLEGGKRRVLDYCTVMKLY